MGEVRQEILFNERSVPKKRVIWCHNGLIILVYWDRFLRGNIIKLGVIIYYVKMMTHILYNLPKEYKNIVENIEYELDEYINLLTIKIVGDK